MEVTTKFHLPSFLLFTIYLISFSSTTTPTSATASVVVKLIHADAHRNLTYQQHIHAAIHRTHHRAQHFLRHTKRGRHHQRSSSSSPQSQQETTLAMPLHGSNGEYLMTLAMGTPPTSFSAIIDTGSTLMWAECYHPTNGLEQPIFDPESSSSYSKVPCSNPICNSSGLHSACNGADCGYVVKYADKSGCTGDLSWETFTLGSLTVNNIGFGCSSMVNGFGHDTRALVGLSRAPLSLISQLGPLIGHQFSYCLGGFSASNQSKLMLGPSTQPIMDSTTTSTPLLVNPANARYYFVGLHGISVGGKRLPISESAFQLNSDGSGGVIIDSGSTFTGLAQEAYSLLKDAFITEVGQSLVYSPFLRLDTCFQGLPDTISIPTLTFHFEGGNLQVPLDNYILIDSEMELSCLAILPTPAAVNIIGSTTLKNFLINFDLGRNIITFTPVHCSRL